MEAPQVVLFNGEPKIRVTKMRAGYYSWATKKTGMMTHSLLKEAKAMIEGSGHKFYVVDQKPDNDDSYTI